MAKKIRIVKPLTALKSKYYARKRFEETFAYFDKEVKKIIGKLELPNRMAAFGEGRIAQLRELRDRGKIALQIMKRDISLAAEVYAEITPLINEPEQFIEQITAARVSEYVAMAERVNAGDGELAAAIFEGMSPEETLNFFQSPNFVPISDFAASEQLLDYTLAFGESPLITRLRDFNG